MKQVKQNYRTGELNVAEVPAPVVTRGNLLLRTTCSLISAGTEKQLMDLAKASLAGKAIARPDLVRRVVRTARRDGIKSTAQKVFAKLDTPIPLGYSLAGEVIELGRGISGFSVGDRVACAGAGLANHAELNLVPKNLTVAIPDNVDDEDASFVTLGAIALQGVRLAIPTLGERFVVMGLGLIGLLTVQLLKANGCRVLGFDPDSDRARLARDMGADIAISSGLSEAVAGFSEGHGADAVIITASSKSNEPINSAAEISRLKGRVVVVGLVGMTIDREPFYKRELDIRLSMSYGPGRHDPAYEQDGHDYPLAYVRWTEKRNMEAFLELIAAGAVTPKSLVTHHFAIADAEKAYAVMESGEPHMAMVLTYPAGADDDIIRQVPVTSTQTQPKGRGIAFIGMGNYAKGVLLPAVRKGKDVVLTSVVTSTGISATHAGQKYGFQKAATEADDVFADDETATVFIATRHDSHAALICNALGAGKNVFCEKPLGLDEEQLDSVIAAAKHAAGKLMIGFNRRFAPMVREARAALQPRAGPLVMVYRINAGTIPADSWVQREEGGGRIIGEVCHFIDTLSYLCGAVPVEAQAIMAKGHGDAVSTLIRFADGSTGTIIYTSLGDAAVAKEYVEVFASGRVIQLDDYQRLTITRNGKQSVSKGNQDKGQQAMVSAFLDSLENAQLAAPIPLEDLVAITQATFAIEEGLRTGRPVSCVL